MARIPREALDRAWACNCIGPQNGEPLCPCQMRGVTVRDGRYVMPERDLGPVPKLGVKSLLSEYKFPASFEEPSND